MNRYKTLASNTIILALGQFGSKLLVLFLMRFYQSMLGETGYGEINTIIDTTTLLMAFATLSIGESVIRFGLDKAYNNAQVFSIGIKVTLAGAIACVIFIPLFSLLSGWFPDNSVLSLLDSYSWITVLYVMTGSMKSTCALFVRSNGNVRLYAVDGIFTTFMNIMFNLLFLLAFQMGNVGYLLSVICADICSIIFLSYLGRLKKYFILFGVDREIRSAMLRFAIPMVPTAVMWWIINVSDTFFVSEWLGFNQSGIYKAAYRLPNMIALISGIFSQAWNMSAIEEKNSRTIAKFYSDVFSAFQSAIFVIGAGMLLLIKPIISVICDTPFHIAYIYTPFLVLAVVYSCFGTFMGSIYVAAKQSKRAMVTATIGALLNIAFNALLIPILGNHGAAIATCISFFALFAIRARDTRKTVYMDLKLRKLVTNTICLFIMGAVIIFVTNDIVFFSILTVIFLFVVLVNYRACIKMAKQILGRGK
ncbi:MAG: polysaccharide biosynthesis C-terminal domain-containing protein [Oscillospiraceae bacterium]|nr:polysaccharide biosynthesis C-terminal domain-containing protein [Oscillospiraceae bacterium]